MIEVQPTSSTSKKRQGPWFGPATLALTSAWIIWAAAHGDPNLDPIVDHCQEVIWNAVKPTVNTVFHKTHTLLEQAFRHFNTSGK